MLPSTGRPDVFSMSAVPSMRVLRFSKRKASPRPTIRPTSAPSASASLRCGPDGPPGATAGATTDRRFERSRSEALLAW